MSANTTLTFNFPLWLLPKWTPSGLPGGTTGAVSVTPNANNQAAVDISVIPLQMLLDAGFTLAPGIGATAARPTAGVVPGQQFFDTTLGYPVFRNAANTAWVNASGSVV